MQASASCSVSILRGLLPWRWMRAAVQNAPGSLGGMCSVSSHHPLVVASLCVHDLDL